MSRLKKQPKQKSSYPGILTTFEKQRKNRQGNIQKFKPNFSVKNQTTRMMQMYSGKRGK